MTESEALTLIHASPRIRHGEAAARMPRLLQLLGHPEAGLPFVHVTGTNGKGSFSGDGLVDALGRRERRPASSSPPTSSTLRSGCR